MFEVMIGMILSVMAMLGFTALTQRRKDQKVDKIVRIKLEGDLKEKQTEEEVNEKPLSDLVRDSNARLLKRRTGRNE